jgi:hypothetical protein
VLRRALGEDAVQSDARQVHVALDALDWTPIGSRPWSVPGGGATLPIWWKGTFLRGSGFLGHRISRTGSVRSGMPGASVESRR